MLTLASYREIIENYRAAVETNKPTIAAAMKATLAQALVDGVERKASYEVAKDLLTFWCRP